MNRLLAASAVAGLTACAAPAFAQTLDGSIGYSAIDLTQQDVGAITARLTWTPTPIFGIEGEASVGVSDQSLKLMGSPPPTQNGSFELKHQVAVYGVAGVPVGENGRVFARVGYGTAKSEADLIIGTLEETHEGLTYGVGGQVLFDGKNGVRADFTKHEFDRGAAETWSISYVRRFR